MRTTHFEDGGIVEVALGRCAWHGLASGYVIIRRDEKKMVCELYCVPCARGAVCYVDVMWVNVSVFMKQRTSSPSLELWFDVYLPFLSLKDVFFGVFMDVPMTKYRKKMKDCGPKFRNKSASRMGESYLWWTITMLLVQIFCVILIDVCANA